MKKKESIVSENIAMNFWGRVEIAQKDAGLETIKDLCREADVPYQTVINERSKGKLPTLPTAIKISDCVNKPVDWLLRGDTQSANDEEKKVINTLLSNKKLFEMVKYLVDMSEEDRKATTPLLKKLSNSNSKKRK